MTRRARRELLFGLLALLGLALFGFGAIASVAIPKLRMAQHAARRAAALQDAKIIQTAQTQYQALRGHFAATLSELGPFGAALIGTQLADGVKDGHRFTLGVTSSDYSIQVAPLDSSQSPLVLGPLR